MSYTQAAKRFEQSVLNFKKKMYISYILSPKSGVTYKAFLECQDVPKLTYSHVEMQKLSGGKTPEPPLYMGSRGGEGGRV